jgi:hypothetical protein
MLSLTNFLTDKTLTFIYKCNKIAKQHYLELWTNQAHSLKEGKLRTYLKIKTNFGYENYLSIIKNFEQRRRLSKFRINRPSSDCTAKLVLFLCTPKRNVQNFKCNFSKCSLENI